MSVSASESPVRKLASGFLAGVASTILFNPYDKALYLMSSKGLSFFNPIIWEKPYQGVTKALYGRIVSYGIYFSFYDFYKGKLSQTPYNTFLAGSFTGLTATMLSHPMNVVKMLNWNPENDSNSLMKIGRKIYETHGLKAIGRALHLTCMRDILFSAIYFSLNQKLNKKNIFIQEVMIAMLAATLASPLNYARNHSFYVFAKPAPSLFSTLEGLYREAKLLPSAKNKIMKIGYIRLGIGPGTLRVGLGMAVANRLYKFFYERMETIEP